MSFSYEKNFATKSKEHVISKRSISAKNQYNFNWVDDKTCEGA